MYSPTTAAPAAMPRQACYVRPGLYHYAPAPRTARGCGRGRSMAALLAKRSPNWRAAWLAANYARHLNGLPLRWPKG